MMESVSQQARRLSSGTVSCLIKNRDYAIIDRTRDMFVAYCRQKEVRPSAPETWQGAWDMFVDSDYFISTFRTNVFGEVKQWPR